MELKECGGDVRLEIRARGDELVRGRRREERDVQSGNRESHSCATDESSSEDEETRMRYVHCCSDLSGDGNDEDGCDPVFLVSGIEEGQGEETYV
jgi:hypothetical protein